MENAEPTNHHQLIVLHPRQATHVAIERTRGAALPSVDTDDRHTAEVDHVNDAVLQRYGVRATVRCSLFHSDTRDGVVERVHVLELPRLDGLALLLQETGKPTKHAGEVQGRQLRHPLDRDRLAKESPGGGGLSGHDAGEAAERLLRQIRTSMSDRGGPSTVPA